MQGRCLLGWAVVLDSFEYGQEGCFWGAVWAWPIRAGPLGAEAQSWGPSLGVGGGMLEYVGGSLMVRHEGRLYGESTLGVRVVG